MTDHYLTRLSLILSLAACSASPSLLDLQDIAPGDDCAAGGTLIQSGLDANGDGVLGEDEVQSTKVICDGERGEDGASGADGAAGLDGTDGTNGTDGTDGTDGLIYPIDDWTQPQAPVGTAVIDVGGGEGTIFDGGRGGQVDVRQDNSSTGGAIKFWSNGSVDASFVAPTSVSTYLGTTPHTFTASEEVALLALGDRTGLVPGQVFMEGSDSRLWLWDGVSAEEVSGFEIGSGVTVTLPINDEDGANVSVDYDIRVLGTLTTVRAADGVSAAGLQLGCGALYVAPTGSIDLSGDSSVLEAGGDGGDLRVEVESDHSGDEELGSAFVYGTIRTAGGEGSAGGRGGNITVFAPQRIINTGDWDLLGGQGLDIQGGPGGSATLLSGFGYTWNSGDIECSGGDGLLIGGDGGDMMLIAGEQGEVRNTGTLRSRGGDVDPSCLDGCFGGRGGNVEFELNGGPLTHSGVIDASGGFGGTGQGGDAGGLEVGGGSSSGWWSGEVPAGSQRFGGDILLGGGDGGIGGGGGVVDVYIDADTFSTNQEIGFYGYAGFDISGGDGAGSGGDGGHLYCFHDSGDQDHLGDGPPGPCVNYVPLDLSGGDGATLQGGNGGDLDMSTEADDSYAAGSAIVYNAGTVNLEGGDGVTEGGLAGSVLLYGFNGAENHGDLRLRGGDSVEPINFRAGGVAIFSDWGEARNTGRIDGRGGDCPTPDGLAGMGTDIEIVGRSAYNSGALIVTGGEADPQSGTGGDGGFIIVYGTSLGTENTSTDIDVNGGLGATTGLKGEVYLDGMNATDDF